MYYINMYYEKYQDTLNVKHIDILSVKHIYRKSSLYLPLGSVNLL